MAFFGDEDRFSSSSYFDEKYNSLSYAGKDCTGINIGPGTHFQRDLADLRNGWKPNTKSHRQPMEKSRREKDRSDFYIGSQLTSDGLVVPYSSDKIKYPSPGQYEPPMNISSHLRTSTPRGRSKSLTRSSSMGTSPRMAPLSATLRGNVLFTGSMDDSLRLSYRGPGSYFQSSSSFSVARSFSSSSLSSPLTKKSFNVRAQNGNLMGQQTAFRKTHNTSSPSSSPSPPSASASLITSPIKTQQQRQLTQQHTKNKIIKTAWSHEGNGPATPGSSFSRSLSRTPIDSKAKYQNDEETPAHVNFLRSDRTTPYHHHPFPDNNNDSNNHHNRSSSKNNNSRDVKRSQQSQRGIQTPQQNRFPNATAAINGIRTPIH